MLPREHMLLCLLSAVRALPVGPSDLVVVVHSAHVENATTARRLPWLPADSRHVIVGGATGNDDNFAGRRLMFVNYDDNPGCSRAGPRSPCTRPTYNRIGKYFGAHRTVAGVYIANLTWPDARWILVCDDDNYVDLATVRAYVGALDARVPLLLAGRVGPGHDAVPCRATSNATHWSCCTDASRPCLAHVSGPQAVWDYDAARGTFAPTECADHETAAYCCRTAPWPEGIHRGFPWRVDGDGSYRPHFAKLWPYGGAGYLLSRGLLDAIPAAHWEACMRVFPARASPVAGRHSPRRYKLQCANADHRVMTCVLAAGFSLTRHGRSPRGAIPGILHHVHTAHHRPQQLTPSQEGTLKASTFTPLHRAKRPDG